MIDTHEGAGAPPDRVVGIGASAGGVDALIKVVGALPADLPAAVCIVLHLAPSGRSLLPAILDRCSALPVAIAADGEPLRAGHVYVAPPDRHLLVGAGRIATGRGPKESGVRPAVDTMLRSLAAAYGPAALAVVLSGALEDGSSGALAVAQAGGTVVVQDPADALVPSMPQHAIAAVGRPVLVLPGDAIGPALAGLVAGPPEGAATGFTCRECNGALWELREGEVVRYRCRIGHSFSEEAMLAEQGGAVESALWAALEVLEERAEFLRRIAGRRPAGQPRIRSRLEAGADHALERADLVRRALAQ